MTLFQQREQLNATLCPTSALPRFKKYSALPLCIYVSPPLLPCLISCVCVCVCVWCVGLCVCGGVRRFFVLCVGGSAPVCVFVVVCVCVCGGLSSCVLPH